MRFQVTITLGNDAMRTRADLAHALLQIAQGMGAAADEGDESEVGRDEIGTVRDINGNRVGEWILGEWTEGENK